MGNDKSKPKAPIAAPPPPAQPKVSEAVKGSQNVRGTVDRLMKRQEYLEKKAATELNQAKIAKKKGNQRSALLHLKKKKLFENEIQKLNGAIMTLETQAYAIEAAATNAQVVDAMSSGAKLQKKLNEQMDVENVEDLMDDIREGMQESDEVAARLGEGIGGVDDLDIEDELRALEEEVASEELPSAPMSLPQAPTSVPSASLPSAPTHTPKVSDDDAALKALEAEMMLES